MTLDSLPPSFMLHHGDCLDVLATLPADSFDCSVEDPPAGIGIEADADSHATALARIAYAYAAAADGKPEAYSPKRAAKLRTKRAVKGNP